MSFQVTAIDVGASAFVDLPRGEWALFVTSSQWGEADLEISRDGVEWFPADTYFGPVVLTSNRLIEVAGNSKYRLSVTSFDGPIVMRAKPVGVFTYAYPETDTDGLQDFFATRFFIEFHRSKLFVGETVTIPINLVQADGRPAKGLDGMELEMVIEGADRVDLAVLDETQLAINGSTITVTIGPPLTNNEGALFWSIRQKGTGAVVAYAQFDVVYVPLKDPVI